MKRPSPTTSKLKGCLGIFVGCALVFSCIAAFTLGDVTESASKRLSSLFGGPPSGRLLDAMVLADQQGRALRWVLVDEGFSLFTTYVSSGVHKQGLRCYLRCRVTLTVTSIDDGVELVRQSYPYEESVHVNTGLMRAAGRLWLVGRASDAHDGLLYHFDPKNPGAGQSGETFAALEAGVIAARPRGNSIVVDTRDGREVILKGDAASGAGALAATLLWRERRARARRKLYRVITEGDSDLTADQRATVRQISADNVADFQRRLERSATRTERRPQESLQQRRVRALRERVRQIRAKNKGLSRARAAAMERFAKRLEAKVDRMAGETQDDQNQSEEPPAKLVLKPMGDVIFMNGWVVASSPDAVVVAYQQHAGPKATRYFVCVDKHGAQRWRLGPGVLPESFARDDRKRPLSAPVIAKGRLRGQFSAGFFMFVFRDEFFLLVDAKTGEVTRRGTP